MKILFVISEVEEFTKTGGLADVGKCLPLALAQLGHDVRIITPYYRHLRLSKTGKKGKKVTLKLAREQISFTQINMQLQGKIPVYGIDYPPYFDRKGIYGDEYDAYPDNGQRFAFFSKAALLVAEKLNFRADILHTHDWHSAASCYFLKKDSSSFFNNTQSILTIHNGAFQGIYNKSDVPLLKSQTEFADQSEINLLALGIKYADKITAVSPNYASELLSHLGSHGLYESFNQRREDVSGILNGCDYVDWSPATDDIIPENYTIDDLAGKSVCKRELQKHFGLPLKKKVPIIGMVCRLTEQKGFGYLLPALEELIHHQVQIIIVGTGDPAIVNPLKALSSIYPKQLAFAEGFSQQLAHLTESGSDFFLMPSLFEPCGLNQMYSLAYGSVPIVRAVGGLKDTVVCNLDQLENTTGFVFDEPNSVALLSCVRQALLCFIESPETYKLIQKNGMLTEFSWQHSAESYQQLYLSLQ
jgi:starch synthase